MAKSGAAMGGGIEIDLGELKQTRLNRGTGIQ